MHCADGVVYIKEDDLQGLPKNQKKEIKLAIVPIRGKVGKKQIMRIKYTGIEGNSNKNNAK